MMKKQWFFKVFKVLHDFDMKLYHVSQGENVEKQMVFQENGVTTTMSGFSGPQSCVRAGDISKKIMKKQ